MPLHGIHSAIACGGDGLRRGFDKLTGSVLDGAVGDSVLLGKVLFEIAKRAGSLLHDRRDAFVPFAALADPSPGHLFGHTDVALELFPLSTKVVRPHEGSTAAVG